jgi:hypothetical protein
MKTLDETLVAFEKYLDNISDSKLNEMLDQIDQMGINGPSVDEYFSRLTGNVSSFYNDVSETSTIADVESLFCDTRINSSHKFDIPALDTFDFCSPELVSPQSSFYNSGESQYLMAA